MVICFFYASQENDFWVVISSNYLYNEVENDSNVYEVGETCYVGSCTHE
jgi:hypothetical protein